MSLCHFEGSPPASQPTTYTYNPRTTVYGYMATTVAHGLCINVRGSEVGSQTFRDLLKFTAREVHVRCNKWEGLHSQMPHAAMMLF